MPSDGLELPRDRHLLLADGGSFGSVLVPSRTKLPVPMFDRSQVSIWSILKQCIGKVEFIIDGRVCRTADVFLSSRNYRR